jgi:transcriptional regulator, AsnC family
MTMTTELLEILLADARQSSADIARQLETDAGSVDAAIEELEAEEVIKGYQAVVDWGKTDTARVRAEVELNVELDRETNYAEIAARIARFPEVASLRLISGSYDFAVDVEAESMQAVSQFVADQIAPIPEVTQTVTHFVMETYKERGIYFDDTDEDDRLTISP